MSIFNPSISLRALEMFKGEMTQKCIANIPVETPCETCGGPDGYLGGGFDPTCPVCDQGVVTTNTQSAFNARVVWVIGVGFRMFPGSLVASGEMGDVILQTSESARPILEAVRSTKDAYIMVDGSRVKPQDIIQNRVERTTTLTAACNVVKDDQ